MGRGQPDQSLIDINGRRFGIVPWCAIGPFKLDDFADSHARLALELEGRAGMGWKGVEDLLRLLGRGYPGAFVMPLLKGNDWTTVDQAVPFGQDEHGSQEGKFTLDCTQRWGAFMPGGVLAAPQFILCDRFRGNVL